MNKTDNNTLQILYNLRLFLKLGLYAEAFRAINDIINRIVPEMNLDQIKKETLSKGAQKVGPVVEAKRDSVLFDKNGKQHVVAAGGRLLLVEHKSSMLGLGAFVYGDEVAYGYLEDFNHVANRWDFSEFRSPIDGQSQILTPRTIAVRIEDDKTASDD